MNPDGASLDVLLDQLALRIAQHLHELQNSAQVIEPPSSPWLNATSAAIYLDWPLQRLYKLTAQGGIPHYKHDGRLLFHRQELDQWLAGHRQGARDWMNGENRAISP